MKRTYLSEWIGEEYKGWAKKKVIMTAPTGMGKTTFIIKVLLPYLKDRKQKLLILCNRKLLRSQYWYDLVGEFANYTELNESVTVMTYQKLAENLKNGTPVEGLFYEYHAIVCDEAHFFYADSDFNGFGTYALLQIIVYAGMAKEMIFMSATMDETKPLIEQTIRNCHNMIRRKQDNWKFYEDCGEIIVKDYSQLFDYDRFHCICVPDEETLCGLLAESQKKSVLFIDNKEKGTDLKDKLLKTKKVESQEILLLNADNIDDGRNSKAVNHLAISHKLIPRILITTSVLDNGVSIHDEEVGNVVIVTESKISFLQMLGRVRAEHVDDCNLYFIKRNPDVFFQRAEKYRRECEQFEALSKKNLLFNNNSYLNSFLTENDEKTGFYRKALVLTQHDYQYFNPPKSIACMVYGKEGLYINEFSKKKTGNLYMAESHFYKLAMLDPLEVIYEQMKWIDKEKEELQVLESDYHKIRKDEFIKTLLKVKDYTQNQLQEFKKELVKGFRRDFFADIPANNGTLSSEKLQSICERFDLQYKTRKDPETQKTLYSIEEP